MARVLLIHHDPVAREFLKSIAADHTIELAKDIVAARKVLVQSPPDLVLVSQDARQEHATNLLRWMRQSTLETPVIAVLGRTGAAHKPALLKLGVAGMLGHPIDRKRLNDQIAAVLEVAQEAAAGPPPITDEEAGANLSMLETALNRRMRCFAGRNQVFIQSTFTGGGTTRPRICLRCPLRADYGLPREVYYEFVRDICCGEPEQCEAVRRFGASRETA